MAAKKKKVTRLENVTASKTERAAAKKSDAALRAGKEYTQAARAVGPEGNASAAARLESDLRAEMAAEKAAARKADEALAGSEDKGPKRVKEGTFKGLGQNKGDWETGKPVVKAHDAIAERIPTSKGATRTTVVRDPFGSGAPVETSGTGERQYTGSGMSDEETHIRLLRNIDAAKPHQVEAAKKALNTHIETSGHAWNQPSVCQGPGCRTRIPYETDQDYCAGGSCSNAAANATPTPRPKASNGGG